MHPISQPYNTSSKSDLLLRSEYAVGHTRQIPIYRAVYLPDLFHYTPNYKYSQGENKQIYHNKYAPFGKSRMKSDKQIL